eukprot:jgi/Chlat1/6251/Chrsp44S05854
MSLRPATAGEAMKETWRSLLAPCERVVPEAEQECRPSTSSDGGSGTFCMASCDRDTSAHRSATITSVHFTTMSPCELEDQSVTKAAYWRRKDYGGLHDASLGPTASVLQQGVGACATCGEVGNCPGHFGHLKLQAPVFNPTFLEYIKLLLDILCPKCARPVLPLVELAPLLRGTKGLKRLKKAASACRGTLVCHGGTKRRGSTRTRDRAKADDQPERNEHASFVQWLGFDKTPDVSMPHASTSDPEELLLEPCRRRRRTFVIRVDKHSKSKVLVRKANSTGRSSSNGDNNNSHDNIQKNVTESNAKGNKRTGSNDQHQKAKSASKVLELFTRVSDDYYVFLGLDVKHSHPTSWLICQLPIPPSAIRFSIAASHCANGPDATLGGLDAALRSIYLANKKVEEAKDQGRAPHILKAMTETLQDRVNAYILGKDTRADSNCSKTDRLPLSLQPDGKCPARLVDGGVTKQGRIRGTVTGKRSDMSARSVITPDPCLAPGEVGIPRSMARALTVPEIVTPYNVQRLERCMKAGPYAAAGVVGANEMMVMGEDGSVARRFNLAREMPVHNFTAALADGHCIVVARHLQDGDLVVMNRQPSLHRQSLMAHSVRVLPTSSLHLNPTVCPAYNADFDGDEMNVFVPQSLAARVDAQELLIVDKVLSEKGSETLLSLRQDALLGSYLLTAPDKKLSTEEFHDLMGASIDGDGIDAADLVPFNGDLFYAKQALNWLLGDVYHMDKRLDKAEMQSLFARIINRKAMGRSNTDPVLLARRLSNMAHAHLARVGFTAGIADVFSPSANNNSSSLDVMAAAGSAGSQRHLTRMREELGQQHGMAGSFPFFPNNAITHRACTGFVRSSLLQGLSPVEFFWHAAEGRRTICLKQCETSTPGYLWKRVSAGMNSIVQAYSRDGTACVQCVQTGRVVQIIHYAGVEDEVTGADDMDDGGDDGTSYSLHAEANQCVGLLAAQVAVNALFCALQRCLVFCMEKLMALQAVCSQMQQKMLNAPNKGVSDDLCTKLKRLLYLHKMPSGMVAYTVALTPNATTRSAKAVADQLQRRCLKQYVAAWELRYVGIEGCNNFKPWLLRLILKPDAVADAQHIRDLFGLAHSQSDMFEADITCYRPHQDQEKTASIDVYCTLLSKAELLRSAHKGTRAAVKRMEQEVQEAENTVFTRARALVTDLLDMTLSGFQRVEDACARIEDDDQVSVEVKCHQPHTSSSAKDGAKEQRCLLRELWEYCLPAKRGLARWIDMLTTQPEDCLETWTALGIEAARAKLLQLLSDVLREADIIVEERHIALIVDYMTWQGRLCGFTAAHAAEWRGSEGVLATAADEQPLRAIKEAAVFGKVDALTGPNARIALGLPCSGGTGAGFDVSLRDPEYRAWQFATPQPWFEHDATPDTAEEELKEEDFPLLDNELTASPLDMEFDGLPIEEYGSMDQATDMANMDLNMDLDLDIDDGPESSGNKDAGVVVVEGNKDDRAHVLTEEDAIGLAAPSPKSPTEFGTCV